MSWVIKVSGKTPAIDDNGGFHDEPVVALLYLTNAFNKEIYVYLRLPFRKLKEMKAKLDANEKVVPSEYGSVLAAGLGEPDNETRDEMGKDLYTIKLEKPTLPNIRPPKLWS